MNWRSAVKDEKKIEGTVWKEINQSTAMDTVEMDELAQLFSVAVR